MTAVSRKTKDWEDPVPPFGSAMREQEFLLEPNTYFLNHGSFGATARRVFEKLQEDQLLFERNPDHSVRNEGRPEWDRVLEALAGNLGTAAANLALVENTTAGISNVLTTYPFQAGDAILINNRTYGAMKNQVEDIVTRRTVGVSQVVIDYPMVLDSSEQIVQLYREAIAANPNIKLTIIDHIASGQPAVFPVKELTALCHDNGIVVIIDGAHVIGHIPLNMDDIGMDFYIGSIYKWSYTGRGCGIQYVAPSFQGSAFPGRVSVSYGAPYPSDYVMQGARDDSAYHSADYAAEFYNWIGGYEAVTGYCVPLLDQAVTMLTEAWVTDKLPIVASMEAPFLKSVRVPDLPAYEKSSSGAWRLSGDLAELYNTWTYVLFMGGEIYIRLSVNIYCELADYAHLRDAILELQQEPPTSERQKKRMELFKQKKNKLTRDFQ